MCKYADDLSQLCPQHTDTNFEEEYIHIQIWADCNKFLINTSTTKEIVLKCPSLRQYVPAPPIMHIEQVDHVKLLWVFFTPILTTSTHINSVISVMNRLYLLNQLRKQGFDIRGLPQIFMGLVVARSHYALPAIAGQILVNDLNRINAVFAKAFRWQLTSIVPSAADIIDNADKKLFHSALNPTHCLHHMLSSIKNAHGRCIRIKGYGRVLPKEEPNVIRTASSSGVCIVMFSIS